MGDGGAITTNDDVVAQQVRMLRNYGSDRKYYNQVQGFNNRLDEVQAAILSVKLPFLNDWNSQRKRLAALYQQYLSAYDQLSLPAVAPGAEPVWHLYVIRTEKRDALQEFLQRKGIGTMIHYPVPPHLQGAYQELQYASGSFPIAENIARTYLSLPLYPGMREEEVQYICHSIGLFW